MSDRRRRDVDDLVAELEDTLVALSDAVDESGAPTPPRTRELLRLTDEYAIPTAIAILEANVQALEFLQGAIRVMDPERSTADGARAVRGGAQTAREGASSLGRASLDRLDRTLDDLETALTDSGVPRDREARWLLSEARRLNDEIRDRVETGERDREAVRIDVESELETIRDEVGSEEPASSSTADDEDG